MGGDLGLPFLYHDPDKEVAYVYMPMEAGGSDVERQQAIGKLTTEVMDSLPPEERKGYLLQPQVFLTMENLTNQLLELEGITPEMIEAQKSKADLLRKMLESESDEALEALIKENETDIDNQFFRLLTVNIQVVESAGQPEALEKLMTLREKLLELTSLGQKIQGQEQALQALRADPTRETMLKLLINAPNAEAREVLVVFGRPLVDYIFFQQLTACIDKTFEKEEKERLIALRKELLNVRERLDEEARAAIEDRANLLRDLLLSSAPENLARRRLTELDQTFLNVLTTQLQDARDEGNEEAAKALQEIWELVMRLSEETLPPVMRLLNRLMTIQDEKEIEEILRTNRALVTPQFVELLEQASDGVREDKDAPQEAAQQLTRVLEMVKRVLEESGA
jgi:hypothetical protein